MKEEKKKNERQKEKGKKKEAREKETQKKKEKEKKRALERDRKGGVGCTCPTSLSDTTSLCSSCSRWNYKRHFECSSAYILPCLLVSQHVVSSLDFRFAFLFRFSFSGNGDQARHG
jgi:hypothetical protein